MAQQEIAKIVLADLAVKHSDKGATKATEIDGSTAEQQIRKAIFHHISVIFIQIFPHSIKIIYFLSVGNYEKAQEKKLNISA